MSPNAAAASWIAARLRDAAQFNAMPLRAGLHFDTIQCFCCADRIPVPGEGRTFPAVFFVDPAFAKEGEMKGIGTLTRSRTFLGRRRPALEARLPVRDAGALALHAIADPPDRRIPAGAAGHFALAIPRSA